MKSSNIPYVKVYDSNGTLKNPIVGAYISGISQRSRIRSGRYKKPMNNRKSTPGRIIQHVENLKGNLKAIRHSPLN